jgi:hypothetical protein
LNMKIGNTNKSLLMMKHKSFHVLFSARMNRVFPKSTLHQM